MEERKSLHRKTLKVLEKTVITRLLNHCTILYFINNLISKVKTEISVTLISIVHLNIHYLVSTYSAFPIEL